LYLYPSKIGTIKKTTTPINVFLEMVELATSADRNTAPWWKIQTTKQLKKQAF
jgi:hypothetical protein